MSSQNPKQNKKANRPTDPFSGPPKRGNTISFTLILAAFAVFLLLQWTGGDIGNLLNAPASAPPADASTVAAPDATATSSVTDAPQDATAIAEPTQAPAATNDAASTAQPRAAQTPRATVEPTPTANAPPTAVPTVARASNLPTIAYAELPPEAHDTIALIDAGGPFPYSRDGVTFENRERILPLHTTGYYREYTVITPGASTRGARRIVTGDAGEMYYTDDHYDSFREIIR